MNRVLMSTFLIDDRPLIVVPYIADLLDGGVRAILYNGDRDMAGNTAGTELLLHSMKWHGSSQWYKAPRGLWTIQGEVAGFAKSVDNLSFVMVHNSGHLVPYNQPGPALDLLTRFLSKQTFYDEDIPTLDIKAPAKSRATTSKFSSSILDESQVQLFRNSSAENLIPLLLAFLLGIALATLWQRRQRGTLTGGYLWI